MFPAYGQYLGDVLHGNLGALQTGEPVLAAVTKAFTASAGLLGLALLLSALLGVLLGMWAVRTDPPRVSGWMTVFTTLGLASPSFYIGILFVAFSVMYVIWGPTKAPLVPFQGYGWDAHLVLPTLAFAGSWAVWYRSRPVELPPGQQQRLAIPGDHQWATERHDAQGTQWTPARGPSQAEILWTAMGINGFTGGPVVDSAGTIYYTGTANLLYAVNPDGESLWQAGLPAEPVSRGSFIFLKNAALAASSGVPVVLEGISQVGPEFDTPTFFIGADGRSFCRKAHTVAAWRSTENGFEMDPAMTWDFANQVIMPPYDQGETPGGLVWMFYSSAYADTRIVWLDAGGKLLANLRIPERDGKVIGVDGEAIVGGALVEGRLYVATNTGTLFAIGKK